VPIPEAPSFKLTYEAPSPEIERLSDHLSQVINTELHGETLGDIPPALLHAVMTILYQVADGDRAVACMLYRAAGAYFNRLASLNQDG
jgi:hypothetical protein